MDETRDPETYCEGGPSVPAAAPGPVDGPFAECVLCRAPTEYPESTKGSTLCPVCEWQEAQRTACSG
uniref:Small CPxCG-related zinc finger protein n=1 Tax=Streptomyces sp. NBC_00003 TaxID=2903608 RepID=A0AAU2V0A1_9ACTN